MRTKPIKPTPVTIIQDKQQSNPVDVSGIVLVNTSLLATKAKQVDSVTSLNAILAKLSSDPSTETTLVAILAKIIATPSTEAKQDTGNTSLASILAKIIAAPSTEAKQDTIITALNSIDAGTAAALGQALMAASVPVTIASNQTEVPINLPASNLSAFGTLEIGELTPIFQSDFVYGLNTQMWNAPVINAGAVVTPTAAAMGTPEAGGRLKITSGVTNGAYGYITTRKIARYRAGQGQVIRFTPLFTAGVANNTQLWGIGSIVSNAPYDGYFFGYNGTSFGIAHYRAGTPTWYSQSADWNGDKVDGTAGTAFTWNKTFGIPCQIKYPYLGYGDILFFVQNPITGRWILVHTIRYSNTTIVTEASNPSLQFVGFTSNAAGTGGSITMYCGSVGIFISGQRSFAGNPKWAADSAGMAAVGTGIKVVGTTETCLLNLRNCTTYNGITNRGAIRLNSISVGNGSTGNNIIIRLLLGTTFTTTPVYTPVSGTTGDNGVTLTAANSIASVDVAGTTITSIANRGTFLFNLSVSQGGAVIDLTPFDLYINPGESLTISGQGTAGTNTTASINWSEDI